ncbi:MAG: class I SAM-dependent methyltransferase [Sphingomonas sp.]
MSQATASHWNAAAYAANAAFVPALGAPVLALLAPERGERILDVGCGDGVLTAEIAAAGAEVVGVDGAPDMVAAARGRGLDARLMDGEALTFSGEFDAAFSNAALHWMTDAPAVAAGVFAALRPGGRFVGEMGGEGNVAGVWRAMRAELAARGLRPAPQNSHWYPSPAAFAEVYGAAGFVEIDARLIPRPTPLPTGVVGWLRTFGAGLLDVDAVPEDQREAIYAAVERRLEPDFLQADGTWVADYVRLRFTMRKPV